MNGQGKNKTPLKQEIPYSQILICKELQKIVLYVCSPYDRVSLHLHYEIKVSI